MSTQHDTPSTQAEHATPHPEPEPTPEASAPEAKHGISRRGLLGALGATIGAAAVAGAGGFAAGKSTGESQLDDSVYAFFGTHQAGITTPVQDRMHFASFDMVEDATRDDLIQLLKDWTYAASRMTQGLEVSTTGAVGGSPEAPPDDTGEAYGLPASGLTITIGFGPTLFEQDGVDRFGIADRKPDVLEPLPPFVGDTLKTEWNHGDLCIQACANDPQVAVHAVRNLTRIAFGTATIRWSQIGFGRTSSTSHAQETPRNLFGFKDGTDNILTEEEDDVEEYVWVQDGDGPDWMTGGSYLVARKIKMLIESWDRTRLAEQERTFGRDKKEGAPLSGGGEFTTPDFSKTDATGEPVIDVAAHVRLAHPDQSKTRLLRRGFNYVDGNDDYGALDAGLFFITFQRSPEQFIQVQRNLSTDLMNEYIRHIGSSVFAIPPGVQDGGYLGQGLFEG